VPSSWLPVRWAAEQLGIWMLGLLNSPPRWMLKSQAGKKGWNLDANLSAFRQTLVEIEAKLLSVVVLMSCPHVLTFLM